MEYFLQGNVPLRPLLNTKPPFKSWQRSALNEVNDWALIAVYINKLYFPESHYQPPPQPKPISPSPQYVQGPAPPSNYPPPAPQPTPSSSYNHPEPTYTPPFKPIYTIPDPIIVKPKPIKPEPVYVKPEPVYVPAPSPSPKPSYVSSTISNSYEVAADPFSFPEEPEDDSYGTPVGQTIGKKQCMTEAGKYRIPKLRYSNRTE